MKILFTGDIILDKDKFTLSNELLQIFKECDIRICNMEAVIANPDLDKPIVKAGPAISQTEIILDVLKELEFNYVSLANNHILDYGPGPLQNTLEMLKKRGIISFGAGFEFDSTYTPINFEIENKKISILACCQAEFGVYKTDKDKFGYAWINHPEINNIIKKTKESADFVFVMIHAGLENIPYPLPEWRARYKELIDNGADCIIGGHPHIAQGFEIYKEKYIFYSLGNFFFESANIKNTEEQNKGIIVVADIKDAIQYNIIPYVIRNRFISIDTSTDTKLKLKYRSDILMDEDKYISEIDKLATLLWHQYYSQYFTWTNEYGIKIFLKNLIKGILNKFSKKKFQKDSGIRINPTLLLHNLQIETHKWIVERHLYNQNRKHNKFD